MHQKHSQVHRWRLLPFLGPLMAVAFTLLLALPVSAATTSISSPVDIVVVDSCTNQLIHFTGVIHDTFNVTENGNKVHVGITNNPQDVTGVDAQGIQYHFTGVTNTDLSFAKSSSDFESTFVNLFNIVSDGSSPNSLLHNNFHLTVTPDGTITVYHDNFFVICQG